MQHRFLVEGVCPDLVSAARNAKVLHLAASQLTDLLRQCLALALFDIESDIHNVTSCFSPLAAV